MFLEEILIYNQDFPKMQKMTQRKTLATQLWTSKSDIHANGNFTPLKKKDVNGTISGYLKKDKRGKESQHNLSDRLWYWEHPGIRALTFISVVMLTVYAGKCHRLQNQQKNARLKRSE